MAEPDALVLMLLVDDRRMRVIRQAMNELPFSRLTLNLDAPLAPQMPADSSDQTRLLERLEHYLKVCPYVIFVVGDAGTPPPLGSDSWDVLKRLVGGIEARAQGGSAVIRMKLGNSSHPSLGIDLAGYELIPDGNERAVSSFIRQATLNTSAAAYISEPSPPEETERPQWEEAEAGSVEETPAPEEVFCSVYAPRLAAPGDEILVQAFAHLRRQEQEAADMAAAADPEAAKVGDRRLNEQVAEGERLGFHLTMRGAEIDVPDQEFVWRREVLAAQFGVYFPETSKPREVVGTVIVTKGDVPVGHVKFTLRVVTREQKESAGSVAVERSGDYSPYRQAFVSYASKDREKVLPRVQALAAAGIDVFQDFIGLEPGERWERGLYKHIDRCDVFFLFWSQAASDSKWVLEEAKYARARQEGKDDRPPEIIPIIIEGPPPVKPPPELNFLHFNDKYIYLLKGVEAEAEARRKEGP
ncbi:MAG TPA: toll/interleukin-1 receptor domain-containing protein [Pyrinomonadaceae bacterium]